MNEKYEKIWEESSIDPESYEEYVKYTKYVWEEAQKDLLNQEIYWSSSRLYCREECIAEKPTCLRINGLCKECYLDSLKNENN